MPNTAENHDENRLVLAREAGFGEVSICNCGAVTLALEGVQLRFSAQAYVRLVQMIGTSVHSAVLQAAVMASEPQNLTVQ